MRADTNYNFAKEITKHFRKHTIGAFVHSYPSIVAANGLRPCVAKIAKMYRVSNIRRTKSQNLNASRLNL